ncbi:MAG: hypothetical protein HQL20_09200 [Candidatus Omnitrophica bacterium]|nr:hypothetical protein [Candidatus Omnitrophota bacterium]
MKKFLCLLVIIAFCSPAFATRIKIIKSSNLLYSTCGNPEEPYGPIRICKGSSSQDVVYSIYDDVYVVAISDDGQMVVGTGGVFFKGNEAKDSDIALAFYNKGKSIKKYSALEIAGSKNNVRLDRALIKGSYEVFEDIDGGSIKEKLFEIRTVDGRVLMFDIRTGELVK